VDDALAIKTTVSLKPPVGDPHGSSERMVFMGLQHQGATCYLKRDFDVNHSVSRKRPRIGAAPLADDQTVKGKFTVGSLLMFGPDVCRPFTSLLAVLCGPARVYGTETTPADLNPMCSKFSGLAAEQASVCSTISRTSARAATS